jgi:hypothetical protein
VIPLYGFLAGDTLGVLVLARTDDTSERLAQRLQDAARARVAPAPDVVVRFAGRVLSRWETVEAVGMRPLDRFDVVRSEQA